MVAMGISTSFGRALQLHSARVFCIDGNPIWGNWHDLFTGAIRQVINEILVVAGIVLVVGAYRRWRWLVDPPIEWSPYYSQAHIRRLFGKTFTVYFTYFLGIVFVFGGGLLVYRSHRVEILSVICASCLK